MGAILEKHVARLYYPQKKNAGSRWVRFRHDQSVGLAIANLLDPNEPEPTHVGSFECDRTRVAADFIDVLHFDYIGLINKTTKAPDCLVKSGMGRYYYSDATYTEGWTSLSTSCIDRPEPIELRIKVQSLTKSFIAEEQSGQRKWEQDQELELKKCYYFATVVLMDQKKMKAEFPKAKYLCLTKLKG
ncbi:hypothetical protein PG999_008496 [Apiospora kogelbergensis]|uniref:Uncharacterized protein n=1 Tax=Apiospora kogelbergensis TaxID=1337665 RepID=A0AAW0QGI0_9PEZI